MEAGFDFATFYCRHRPHLQQLAAVWFGRESDDADEAVQDTFVFALENPHLIPSSERGAQNWLVAILRFRVQRIRSSRFVRSSRFPNKPHARFCFVPTYDRGDTGSNSHYLAETAEARGDSGEYDELLNSLTREQRELLFAETGRGSDWTVDRRRAELRATLLATRPSQEFSPSTRVLDFIRHHAASRSLSRADDYLSQFRVIQRRMGRALRLSDLTDSFYSRFVASLSASGQKRVRAIWNAAARAGLAQRFPRLIQDPLMSHPVSWSTDKLERFLTGAARFGGTVRGTPLLNSEFWPAIVSVAAESGLAYSTLLSITWPKLRTSDIMSKASARTVDFLERLESRGSELAFPFNPRDLFYKHYSKVLRLTGLTASSLTQREYDVLLGTAAGMTEGELAKCFRCCHGVIIEYRRRLREKLGLRADTSLKVLVETAQERGLLSDDVNTDSANDHVYTRRPSAAYR